MKTTYLKNLYANDGFVIEGGLFVFLESPSDSSTILVLRFDNENELINLGNQLIHLAEEALNDGVKILKEGEE